MKERWAGIAVVGVLVLSSTPAQASQNLLNLGVFVGGDYLASTSSDGGGISAGLRLGVGRYFAAGVDVGYGLLDASSEFEDRWWLIPTVAFSVPTGPVTLDIGGGFGVATVSGYESTQAYFAAPFGPAWHITAPAVRGHIMVTHSFGGAVGLFGRAEVGTLLSGTPPPGIDAFWVGISAGIFISLI